MMNDPTSDLDATVTGTAPGRKDEITLVGIGVSPGIAIGPAYVYTKEFFNIDRRTLQPEEVEEEVARFERAVSRSERELRKIGAVTRERLGDDSAEIFEAQLMMLRDESLYPVVVSSIQEERCNADYAVQSVMMRHRQLLVNSDSEYLRERANDLLDVQDRIIRNLRRGKILSSVDSEKIVIAESLTAADIILFSRRNILACATDYGGATSHVSIVARALNVPAVVSLHGISEVVEEGDVVVLDGIRGRVVVNPTPETLAAARTQQERYKRFLQEQKQLVPLPAETMDGHVVQLYANLEFREELDLIADYGAEGIGLFRTEILFMMQGRISFTEDEQFEIYRQIVQRLQPKVTTFRVLDLGGDKVLPLAHREDNPFLGWRGIRILLDRPELLLPQLRALLRASAYGPIRILIPMVTSVAEVQRFRAHLEEARRTLEEEGIRHDSDIPLGIMVEVPSVAVTADHFVREADFLSIGSNDLTQYVLAVDRGNDLVSGLYAELHPAVLSMIKMTVDAARRYDKPVSICGELAANPRAAAVLVGLGLTELSMSPRYMLEVKRVIRSINHFEAVELADEVLQQCNAAEVGALVDNWFSSHGCDPNMIGF